MKNAIDFCSKCILLYSWQDILPWKRSSKPYLYRFFKALFVYVFHSTTLCHKGKRLGNFFKIITDIFRQEALRNVIEKSNPSSRSDLPSIMNCSNTTACERSEHKNFIVVSHGFPIDPDYAIMVIFRRHSATNNSAWRYVRSFMNSEKSEFEAIGEQETNPCFFLFHWKWKKNLLNNFVP